VRVLDRHPEGTAALPGYVWLDTPGKVLHVDAHLLVLHFPAGVVHLLILGLR
jgi:hypothetical protein